MDENELKAMLKWAFQERTPYTDRKIDRYESETLLVSTVGGVTDADHPYETAVAHREYAGGKIVIVEGYDTAEAAQEGHNKWVATMTTEPLPDKISDCAHAKIAKAIIKDDPDHLTFPRVKRAAKQETMEAFSF